MARLAVGEREKWADAEIHIWKIILSSRLLRRKMKLLKIMWESNIFNKNIVFIETVFLAHSEIKRDGRKEESRRRNLICVGVIRTDISGMRNLLTCLDTIGGKKNFRLISIPYSMKRGLKRGSDKSVRRKNTPEYLSHQHFIRRDKRNRRERRRRYASSIVAIVERGGSPFKRKGNR